VLIAPVNSFLAIARTKKVSAMKSHIFFQKLPTPLNHSGPPKTNSFKVCHAFCDRYGAFPLEYARCAKTVTVDAMLSLATVLQETLPRIPKS
jgi:hypothetical protein